MEVRYLELFEGLLEFSGNFCQTVESDELSKLDNEYSISLWVCIHRHLKNRPAIILNKATENSFQPKLAIQDNTVIVTFDTKRGPEMLFSASELPTKTWVHIAFTMRQDELTEAVLYINGQLSSEMAVKSPLVKNDGKFYVGKDPWSSGIIGYIAEPMFFFNELRPDVVLSIYTVGSKNFKQEGIFKSTSIFVTSDTGINFRRTLPNFASTPVLVEGLDEQIVKKPSQMQRSESVINQLDKLFERNRALADKAAMLVQYFDWLVPLLMTLRSSLPNFRDEDGAIETKIEVDRMLPALYQLRLPFKRTELVDLAKSCEAYEKVEYNKGASWNDTEVDDIIDFIKLLESIRNLTTFEDFGTSPLTLTEEVSPEKKYTHHFRICEEFLSKRNGSIEVCVDFCTRCDKHQTTTWHQEKEFANMFNSIYKDLSEEFPSVDVVGNKYGPPPIGTIAVYLEGVGSLKQRDKEGRLYIYKKKNVKPCNREIIDGIYLLAYCYGDMHALSEQQLEYKRKTSSKSRHPEHVTDIVSIPDKPKPKINKQTGEIEYDLDQQMFCTHWGCTEKLYIHGKNHKKACRHHPGRWEFGSIHGLWPENWTCCRGEWTVAGCRRGFHKGIPYSFIPRKCVNRGEVNPSTHRPDSICGKTFPDPASCGKKYKVNSTECCIHSGYKEFKGGKIYAWTCCGAEVEEGDIDNTYCTQDAHRFAEWPDEEAKIYFVTKSNSNPGSDTRRVEGAVLFKAKAHTSRFFNMDIQPYVNANPQEKKKQREALANELRHCLNWGCESSYKEAENTDKSCRCHTGYWDFGHSGILKSSKSDTETIILWEPHWRCCGGKWEDPGCKLIRHDGPLLSSITKRKWKWPEEGAKRYFIKKTSKHWQKKLEGEHFTRAQVSKKYDSVCKQNNCSKLPSHLLHRLCLALNLHILCVSDDMGYTFKYQDMITRDAERMLNNGTGYIDKDTFLDWWFAPLEVIRPEMKEPEKI